MSCGGIFPKTTLCMLDLPLLCKPISRIRGLSIGDPTMIWFVLVGPLSSLIISRLLVVVLELNITLFPACMASMNTNPIDIIS